MARGAVKAKQAQKAHAHKAQPRSARAKGRRGHASGGNPNQQLFFSRLRRKAKFAYLLLAVLFAVTFAFLGVGSGSNGLDQLFSGLNIFSSGGNSISKAQAAIKKHPNDPKGYTDLATAYRAKNDTASAIAALQQLTAVKPKDGKAWTDLGNLQLAQAQSYVTDYQAARSNQQLAAPSQGFAPTGKLAAAFSNPIEQAAASTANSATNDFYSRATLGFQNAVNSYKQLVRLDPTNPNAQFQLAQAAQTSGDRTTAIAAYTAYVKLNPSSSTAAQIRQLIKQLSPAPVTPVKKKK